MKTLTAAETRKLLPFPDLVETLRSAVRDYHNGQISCPERMVVPTIDRTGTVMSMIACAPDILTTKLLTLYNGNTARDLPAIQGQVTCMDAIDGRFLFSLNGVATTERRTAAISMLGLERFRPAGLKTVLLIGTGVQAKAHLEALNALYPGITVYIRGRSAERVIALIESPAYRALQLRNADREYFDPDVVITVTSSQSTLYDEPPVSTRLIIGVGAYRPEMIEIGPTIVNGSTCIVDDPIGAPSEAGDIIQARKDWREVKPLAAYLSGSEKPEGPVFFKSVGCAAWDLAACRLARRTLGL
ncbi:ornithine cyclodeaminase [Gluconobacter thailandicus F149-1 = NBRC 100600]|uniref:Ornithine cyclodeaminase n=1 Tax=Gluconobacter thailandicus NBRC 3257 TaxID=1381097 RepID=A0ABQ0ITW5_GLUTH|nr:delta(1)-pyrroline-2-carboxylate reductase family protein [Gluconobacter thailandicus]KXV54214.1 ornithine cyclodeaminase [Gluconobacter thailandicus]GAC88957.1 ornithine cyclodeaminase [Gluconobacter thailandicus NBRC 3255]GAD25661.1 ornithine cyclodeaminase [Gluconobacter thailandicus NBRC 3257]GAN92441.1 ornithine cyclodeaminase [Gluconobacter thailandicus F149-1 = NBRC 100600]GBR61240.1 ornithine cyclodeaminase [Gluconobacter thailandicus F149-1 = NBRC 100600]